MTQTVQKNQYFADPELARLEQERRADLAANPAYARGIEQAQQQFKENTRLELEAELANLRRVSPDRDRCQATRDGYERCYKRLESTARRYAGLIGAPVQIPKYLPKPSTRDEFVNVGPAPAEVATYRETRGLGPSGRGIPPAIPGTASDHGWADRPEEQGGGKRSAKR